MMEKEYDLVHFTGGRSHCIFVAVCLWLLVDFSEGQKTIAGRVGLENSKGLFFSLLQNF